MSKSQTDMRPIRTVGVVGVGVMGSPIAKNLKKHGFDTMVHAHSTKRREELEAIGCRWATTLSALWEECDVIITVLPTGPDVLKVIASSESVAAQRRRPWCLLDVSTTAPSEARESALACQTAGLTFVDAPVSGGEIAAIEGTLSLMVGGEHGDVHALSPIFDAIGARMTHIGPVGAGQTSKACNQLLVALHIQATAEALALAQKAGVDAAAVREAMLGGLAASRVLDVHGQRMLSGNHSPGFRLRLHLKDAHIVADLARQVSADVPAFDTVAQQMELLVAGGNGELDHSALWLAVAGPTEGSAI